MLDAIVTSLDDFRKLAITREVWGKDEQYDTLSTALLWVVAQALEADFDANASNAWKMAMEQVTETMLEGTHDLALGEV